MFWVSRCTDWIVDRYHRHWSLCRGHCRVRSPQSGQSFGKKDYIPHVHFRFRPGTRKWVKSSLIATIWAFNIRRFEGAIPKSLSTPFERTETVRRQPLLLNHRPHRVRTPRLQFAPSVFWDFTLTVQAVFGNRSSFWVLWWVYEGPSRIETKSVTLDCGRYHGGIYNPKFGKSPLHIRGRSTRAIVPPSVVKMYVYSRYLLGSRWSSQNTFARFYKLDVQSLASQVRSVSN